MAAEQVDEMEYRMICAHHGEAGHEYHHFAKYSENSAVQSAIDRNHKGEIDAQMPANLRYMDHTCLPYKPQQRPVHEWSDIT